jgi:hypothetical protein
VPGFFFCSRVPPRLRAYEILVRPYFHGVQFGAVQQGGLMRSVMTATIAMLIVARPRF